MATVTLKEVDECLTNGTSTSEPRIPMYKFVI